MDSRASRKFLLIAAMGAAALFAFVSSSPLRLGRGVGIHAKTVSTSFRPTLLSGQRANYMNKLRGYHCQVPCGIFDDPKTVEEVRF